MESGAVGRRLFSTVFRPVGDSLALRGGAFPEAFPLWRRDRPAPAAFFIIVIVLFVLVIIIIIGFVVAVAAYVIIILSLY